MNWDDLMQTAMLIYGVSYEEWLDLPGPIVWKLGYPPRDGTLASEIWKSMNRRLF